jgi:hypothetical protein
MDAVLAGKPVATGPEPELKLEDPDMQAVARGAKGRRAAVQEPPEDPEAAAARALGEGSEAVLATATGGAAALGGGLGYLGTLGTTGDPEAAKAVQEGVQDALTYRPRTEAGRKVAGMAAEGASYLGQKEGEAAGDWATEHGWAPWAAAGLNTALNIPQFLLAKPGATLDALRSPIESVRAAGGALKEMATPRFPALDEPVATMPPGTARVSPQQSIGAAATAVDKSTLSPELAAAISEAEKVGDVNPEVVAKHVRAESLPVGEGETPLRLRKGQATGDSQQISDEKNMRADKDSGAGQILSDSIDDQNTKLMSAQDEIRRQANPDLVGDTMHDHGQAAVAATKTMDNARLTDIKAKYKALADANGGDMPIDTGTAVQGIDASLKKGYLTTLAENHSVLKPILDDLRSGNPINFEQFEAMRSRLAEVQRGGGSDAAAAGIVRDGLENMPLSSGANGLKGLADSARSAYKARAVDLENNPAYKAVANDNVPKTAEGLHDVNAPSPLADNFMDKYVLSNSASSAHVARLQKLMAGDPSFAARVEASTLDHLKAKSGGDDGFNYATFRNGLNNLEAHGKLDVTLRPTTTVENAYGAKSSLSDAVQNLKESAGDVVREPKSGYVNRSHTAIAAARMGEINAGAEPGPVRELAGNLGRIGVNAAAAHAGPLGVAASTIGDVLLRRNQEAKAIRAQALQTEAVKQTKLDFANEATAVGAGIRARSGTP